MMPVVAASSTPISVTVMASPPRTPPNSRAKLVIRLLAIPDRSSSRPMRMNMGSATITQFSMTFQMRSTVSDV